VLDLLLLQPAEVESTALLVVVVTMVLSTALITALTAFPGREPLAADLVLVLLPFTDFERMMLPERTFPTMTEPLLCTSVPTFLVVTRASF
jgi:hypothetical protein